MRTSLLLALLASPLIFEAPGTLNAQTHAAALVRQGDVAPGTNRGTYLRFGYVSINDLGQIAFEAAIDNSDVKDGVFLYSNGRVTPVALWGETAPGTEGGKFVNMSLPLINNRGEILFRSRVEASPLFPEHGLFLFSGGTLTALALAGQPIPGMDARFGNIGNHAINDSGLIAFNAVFCPQQGDCSTGIFVRSEGTITPVLMPAGPLLDFNNRGSILFASDSGFFPPVVRGLSLKVGDTVRELFDSSFGYWIKGTSLNDQDQVVFIGVNGDRQAVFRVEDSGPVEIVGPNSPTFPGSTVFFSSPVLNERGVLSFIGSTAVGAIYMVFPDGDILQAVSEIAGGFTSGEMAELRDHSMNNRNQLAVIGKAGLHAPDVILLARFGGSEVLHFAHFADGSDDAGNRVASRMTLVNPSSTRVVTGEIEVLGDDGRALAVDLNGGTTLDRRSFTVAPGGSAVFTSDGLGELQQGSVTVTADGLLAGFILFEGSAIGVAGLERSVPMQTFLAPVETDRAGGISTGVAVMNLDAEEKTLQAELRDADGNLVATGLVTRASDPRPLAAGGHLALFLEEFQWEGAAPDLSQFQGHLKVTASSGQIAALVLRLDLKTRQLASLPVAAAR